MEDTEYDAYEGHPPREVVEGIFDSTLIKTSRRMFPDWGQVGHYPFDKPVSLTALPSIAEFASSWMALYKASPETVQASKVAWFTIPRAKQSQFKESAPPMHLAGQSELASVMVDLAGNGGPFLHMDLDQLRGAAQARVRWENPGAQRTRLLREKAASRPKLAEAMRKGIPDVLGLAKLSPAEELVARAMVTLNVLDGQKVDGMVDKLIADAINFGGRIDSIREKRRRVLNKLKALSKEEA